MVPYKMWHLVLVLATAWLANAEDLPPTCSKPVYCDSKLLHHAQMAHLFEDSKTFVDLIMNYDPDKTLADFDDLLTETNQNPSRQQVQDFVDQYFSTVGELEEWIPTDFNSNPPFVETIKDEKLKQFALDINNVWPVISRKVKDIVHESPERFSLIPLKHGLIIPGGRFKEIYYWDTYWVVEGLLVSGMYETAKGVIENLIELLELLGHIPNASRWYYEERSQPPLLADMVALYYEFTNDVQFIKDNIASLEKEVDYWLDNKLVNVEINNQAYRLLRYYAPTAGPRPESYREDYEDAQKMEESARADFYIDIKSAAESGFDFSSRWFVSADGSNNGSLSDIHTQLIIPVDLNAIFTGVLQNVANFHTLLLNGRKAIRYAELANEWRTAIHAVLWSEEEGVWFDYDIRDRMHRKFFYTSNVAPLWQGAVSDELVVQNGPKVLKYLQESGSLEFPGGVPTSLLRSGEQWDFPNVWAPEVSIVVNALEAIKTEEADKLAIEVAETFVQACLKGFTEYKQMFEKYDAEYPGEFGSGGEYVVQPGFGWTNGAVLEFLHKYGDVLRADSGSSKN